MYNYNIKISETGEDIMKKLGFGLMRLPLTAESGANDYAGIDIETVKKMVDIFMSNGFTYYDTAYVYHQGKSEEVFREAVVKRYPRENYTITDKMPMFDIKEKEQLEKVFDEQLKRCGVEYFDYYWLHALGKATYERSEKLGAFEFIAAKKAEGKIKHIGFSFHDSAEVLEEILRNHPEIEYVQLQLNYLDWEDDNVQAEKCYNVAVKYNKPVIVMEPVKGGALARVPKEAEKLFKAYDTEASPASWAVRYAASKENVMTVLSGMSNIEQVIDNTDYMKEFRPINDEEKHIIDKASRIIKGGIAIPCTACRYCVDGCPAKIAIPEYFALYNELKKRGEERGDIDEKFAAEANTHSKPSDCIKCRRCENSCPQHLPVTEYLKMVSDEFEGKAE